MILHLRPAVSLSLAIVCTVAASAILPETDLRAQETAPSSVPKEFASDDQLFLLDETLQSSKPVPRLELGDVGSRGRLSIETMRLEKQDPLDDRRRGAVGVRVRIPVGRQK